MRKIKSLLLFTNNYPLNYGDSSFIQPEVKHLSEIYENVYIIRFFNSKTYPVLEMPANFHIIEAGFNNKFEIVLKGLFNTSSLWKTIKILKQEYPHLKKLAHFKHLIFAILTGRYFSSKVNHFLKNQDSNTQFDAYLFWGMGSGYALPWIDQTKLHKSWIRLHGGDLYLDRQHGYLPIRFSLFESSHHIITISKQGAEYLNSTYPNWNLNHKISTNYLGTEFHGSSSNQKESDSYVIVSCSSIIPLKRVDLIYQSIRLVSKSLKITWHHFGGGTDMPKLKSLIETDNYNPDMLNINLHGQTNHNDIIEFYKNNHIDLFINLSETEGIPVSIMEAISFNIPVIATNVGGVSEIIHSEFNTGILVSKDVTSDQVKNHILNMKNQKFTPYIYWEENFNKDKNILNLIQYLNL
ncbi:MULTISPECIES: glycosyltransferase [Vitreoscilla]|uniref:Glycosyltransferase n=1 Tax=Vitreoscilla stercoraria TaxID=61 RepID=A0ABY4E9L4_VITST|nr:MULTISPECIES: glycosyltransferase [Vitreoscilla]AUZ04145.2 family 1 glycosyl transferase [Vitreoscilla sp. C1]UOO92090.1 glycosyltransferase [Vitreoscilla stercoraria]